MCSRQGQIRLQPCNHVLGALAWGPAGGVLGGGLAAGGMRGPRGSSWALAGLVWGLGDNGRPGMQVTLSSLMSPCWAEHLSLQNVFKLAFPLPQLRVPMVTVPPGCKRSLLQDLNSLLNPHNSLRSEALSPPPYFTHRWGNRTKEELNPLARAQSGSGRARGRQGVGRLPARDCHLPPRPWPAHLKALAGGGSAGSQLCMHCESLC